MEEQIFEWLSKEAGAPCRYVFDNIGVADYLMIHSPDWCYTERCEDIKECWRKYFIILFNQGGNE
ncbi:MAG: hypothetical protein IKN54_02215 [Lachnospiraceae bacterium]|nr:hypothetical protein [Lachnospiraceae bacterium]